MHELRISDEIVARYFDEEDIAPCRLCKVQPVYKGNVQTGGYIRCPKCGIKTGTCTSGLGGLIQTWNGIMVDGWEDPR